MNHKRILTKKEIEYCCEFRKQGLSIAKINKQLKTTQENIRQALILSGFEISRCLLKKIKLTIDYFKKIDSPEKAYWLGYIAADGCVHRHGGKISIVSKDADILPKFQKAIGATSPVRYRETLDKRTRKIYSSYSIQICSKQFANFVRSHGIDGDKSRNFKFPTHLPKDLWVHFIRGMFDGDGGLMIRGNITNINIVSTLEGAIFLRDFVKNELRLTVKKLRSVPEQGIHYFEMTKDSVKFLEWIYGCSDEHMRLDRKYEKFLKSKELLAMRFAPKFIIESPSGEIFKTHSLKKFCKEKNLKSTALLVAFKKKRPTMRGKCVGWNILTKNL